jgi:osmotically-inducible protein OsmY
LRELEWEPVVKSTEIGVSVKEGVVNLITVKPRVSASNVKAKIEEALRRIAEVDAKRIEVETTDSKVILREAVRCWAEKEEAQRAAWRVPGVKEVENHIMIAP